MHNIDLRSPSRILSKAHLIRLSITQLATAGLLAAALPATALTYDSTYRSTSRDYGTCVTQMKGTGVVDADAASACAAALYPKDLSSCVVNIDSRTTLTAADALSSCRRVRRPVELATCVVDIGAIDSSKDTTSLLNVMDHCRRSLLPVRFSACVVGLRSQASFSTETALSDCIAATNRPRDVLPNFLPGTTEPTQPPAAQPSAPLQQEPSP
ncbi:MAG TPA: hypothetical protein V6C57_02940 [Coleofasciculaceae cyanobacterium]